MFDYGRRALLMMAAPMLGIPFENVESLLFGDDASAELALLSIVDGTGDLPMAQIEGEVARRALIGRHVVLNSGIEPLGLRFLPPLMNEARVIHIACHGHWIPTHPWTSALMLGPQCALFGATVRTRMQLSRSMVVLSACESGIGGAPRAGEDGLVEAFLLAGASTVVASQWMVHDLSSLVFAEAFFEELARSRDAFEATSYARRMTRNITVDALGQSIDRWAPGSSEARAVLEQTFQRVSANGDTPFLSPIHWGAHFVATNQRTPRPRARHLDALRTERPA